MLNKSKEPDSNSSKNNYTEMNYTSDSIILKQVDKVIFLENLANLKLRSKIIRYLHLTHLLQQRYSLSINKINNILNRLKYSGFFSCIKMSPIKMENKNYIIIHFKLNSILKKIRIINSHKLQIPKKYLKRLFNYQVGYPQNFTWISINIRKILFWYLIRGYKWVRITVDYAGQNNEELNIKILESRIYKIKLSCDTFKGNRTVHLNSIIMHQLQILPNQIPNVKRIEDGISSLKDKKILSSCNYKIIYTSDNKLEITIKYRQTKDKETFVLNKNWFISHKLCCLFHKHLNHLFNYIISKRLSWTYLSCNYNLINSRLYPFIYPLTSSHDLQFNDYITSNFMQIEEFFKFWNLNRSILSSANDFEFRHYINNLSKNCNNLAIYLQFHELCPVIHINYLYNKFQINKIYQYELIANCFQDKHKVIMSFPPIIVKKAKHNKIHSYNFIYTNGLNVTIKNKSYENLLLLTRIGITNDSYNYSPIYRNYFWNKLNIMLNMKSDHCFFKKQTAWITKSYLNYILNYKYNTLNMKKTLVAGKLLNIRSQHVISLINQEKELNYIKKVHKNLNIRYTHIINISKCIFEKSPNSIIIDIEMNRLNRIIKYTPKNSYLTPIYYWSYNLITSFHKSYNINLEYHIPFRYSSTVFFGIDYFRKFHPPYGIINFNTNFLNLDTEYLSAYTLYNVLLGTGLQINLPIKKLPPIRLKYNISVNKIRKFSISLLLR
uniref:POTRA domain-containing protein n=1 Tax=Rhodogorgon sp. TaxID=2485824 RepID=A0A3G3MI39_9FLOR|nr:hypothetical protein [Rhodogorgon sp.]